MTVFGSIEFSLTMCPLYEDDEPPGPRAAVCAANRPASDADDMADVLGRVACIKPRPPEAMEPPMTLVGDARGEGIPVMGIRLGKDWLQEPTDVVTAPVPDVLPAPPFMPLM
jgi:hypothetical protein